MVDFPFHDPVHDPSVVDAPVGRSPGDRVLSREIDGETVLFDLRSGMCLGLNEVGTFVWRLIGARQTVSAPGEIADAVASEFEVDRETARRDLDRLLAELSSNGLVRTYG